jgi:hypothetical protein
MPSNASDAEDDPMTGREHADTFASQHHVAWEASPEDPTAPRGVGKVTASG